MRYSLIAISICCLFTTFVKGQDDAGTPFRHQSKIEAFVKPFVDAKLVNAVSIGVVDGETRWTGHFGHLSEKVQEAPNDQTLYEIGSISKVFTGTLLGNAVATGQVKLEQPIGEIAKEASKRNPNVANSIQLIHLSTHNSGLPRMPDNWKPADDTKPYVDYDRRLLMEFVANIKPAKKPNQETLYSNVGMGLLGELLSIRSNQSYASLLEHTITRPLKMDDTFVALSADQLQRLAPPHNADLAPQVPWDFDALAGAGGIRSTVPDMIRFIAANLDPPKNKLGEGIDLAWKQHVPSRGGQFAMGLGWHIAGDGSTRWHNGETGGFHSAMFVNRPLNAGVIVLSNTATGHVDRIAESIIRIMADIKVPVPKFDKTVDVDEKTMKRLEGRYQIVPQFILDVKVKNGHLLVQATNQPALRVYPKNAKKWSYRVVDAQLTFELPETGPAKSVTLHQNGRNMPAPRIK